MVVNIYNVRVNVEVIYHLIIQYMILNTYLIDRVDLINNEGNKLKLFIFFYLV